MADNDPDVDELNTDLNYGASARRIEPYGIEHIPETDRHGKPFNQFTTWIAANLTLSLLISGFFPAFFGLSLWQSLSAVAVGGLIGSALVGVLSTMGVKLGVPIQIQARGPLGFVGNLLPVAFVNVFASVGWATVNTVFAVVALQQIVDIPFWLGAGILLAFVGVIAIWGYNLLHLINKISTVVLGALFLFITVLALGNADWSYGVNPDADGYIGEWGGWITAVGFFIAWSLAWTPFASDFARYLPVATRLPKVAVLTGLGNLIPSLWLGATGVLVANFASGLPAVQAIAELTGAFAPIAMIALVLGSLPTNGLVVYGGALSLLTLGIRISRQAAAAIIVGIAFVIALLMQDNIYNTFYNFLILSGYFIAPYIVVIILDYFVGSRTSKPLAELFDPARRFEWGFVAWILGAVLSSPFWVWTEWTGPLAARFPEMGDLSYFVGGLVAAVSFLLLRRLPPLAKGNPALYDGRATYS